MASARLYGNLHLAPDNHASTPPLRFLQVGCPSCRPTNSIKALKDVKPHTKYFSKFSVHDARGRGLVILWWHCDRLFTSGFVDWIMSCFYIMAHGMLCIPKWQ